MRVTGGLEFGGFVEDGGFLLAFYAVVLRCPGSALACESPPGAVAAGCGVEVELGQSCGVTVGQGVHYGCCGLGSQAAVVGGQAGDGHGARGGLERDGAGSAGLSGRSEDLLHGWGGELSCLVAGGGESPRV